MQLSVAHATASVHSLLKAMIISSIMKYNSKGKYRKWGDDLLIYQMPYVHYVSIKNQMHIISCIPNGERN